MAEFNHISVNTNDDEEVVFVVGAKAPAAQPASEPQMQSAPELEPEPEVEIEVQPQPASARAQSAGYEATRADLDAAPMSGLQKIIIAAAVLGIIAFVIYNFMM